MTNIVHFTPMTKYLIYLNLFFLQSYLIRFEIGAYPSNLQEILMGVLGVGFLVEIIRNKRFKKTIKNISKHWVILAFIALTGLSFLLTTPKDSLDYLRHLKFLFFAVIFTFIFLETLKGDTERKKALKWGAWGAITFGLFSIIWNLLGHNVALDLRLLGPLDSAVYLAYYLTPFFLFTTISYLENLKDRENLIASTLLGILIILTQSMGAIGGSFLVILLYILIKHRKKLLKKTVVKIALPILAAIVVGTIFYTKILPTLETSYSSLDERGEIWATALNLTKEPETAIYGLGLGQFQAHYFSTVSTVLGQEPLDYYVLQPHNIFFLFIFHFGILGLIFILFCMGKTIKKLPKISAFILLYFFIHGLIDTPIFKNDLLILFVLFLELALIAAPKQDPSKQNKDHLPL